MNKTLNYFWVLILLLLILSGCKKINSINSLDSEITNTENITTTVETAESDTTISESEESETTAFILVTETIYETEGNLIRDLEYPQIVSEDNSYSEINETIKNMVINLNTPDWEISDNTEQRGFTGRYEIIYQAEDVISIQFNSTYFGIGMAYPIASRYGLTIDLNTLTPMTLNNYFSDVESIVNQIDADNYTIVDGGMVTFSKEEINSKLQMLLEDDKLHTYTNNFYIDENSIYIIDNSMIHALGDYSIIKLPLETSPINE